MNSTLKTFGYPENLIYEYKYWVILLRKEQVTLGSVVLCNKSSAAKFSELNSEAFLELNLVIKDLEKFLKKKFNYNKINYLMLMMVDPHVHFHVIPRYNSNKTKHGVEFKDIGWPLTPNLKSYTKLDKNQFTQLLRDIKNGFTSGIKENKKQYHTAYTTGVYDLFHIGHLNLIKKTSEIAEKIIVGVSTDELVMKEKRKKPFIPFKERCEIIESLKFVDKVIPQNDKNKQIIVDKYNIDVITVGSDWKGKYPPVTCSIEYFDYTESTSSTIIQNLIKNRLLSEE